jgi:hypothetical protein
VSVVCCHVEASATGRSLVQRSPTECGVSVCDRVSSTMRKSWPTGGCCATVKKNNKGDKKGAACGTYTPRKRGKDNINMDLQ